MSNIEPTKHERYDAALWYAWGQQDAGIGKGTDVFDFALAHTRHAMRWESGEVSHLPSVQDAWKAWINPRPVHQEGEVGVYATLASGKVHIVDSYLDVASQTLCGQPVPFDVVWGDETTSGIAATCIRCKTIMRGGA